MLAQDIPDGQVAQLGEAFRKPQVRRRQRVQEVRILRFGSHDSFAVFHGLLRRGVYMPPSPFEVSFLSTAHTEEPIQKTIAAWEAALEELD